MFIDWNLSQVRDVVLCFEYSLEENCSIKKSKNVWDRIVQYYWESFIINDTKINYITDIIIWFNLKSKGTLTFVYRNLLANREFQKYKMTCRAYMFKGFILYITVPFLFIIVQEWFIARELSFSLISVESLVFWYIFCHQNLIICIQYQGLKQNCS